jgi:hypothetical protein
MAGTRYAYIVFEFIPRCPERRDFRFAPTSSGEFKLKKDNLTEVPKVSYIDKCL